MPGRDLPDLEERLRRLPAALAVEAPAGLAERIARGGRRRRRLRRAAAAAVVAALVAGAVVTRAVVLDRAPTPVLDPGLLVRNATPTQLAGGHWRPLPVLPRAQLAGRHHPVVAWTGRQLIVWGGHSQRGPDLQVHADGAGYDPRRGRWGPLPPAPEGQLLDYDAAATAWTGREVLVWGLTPADPAGDPNLLRQAGLAYDPARGTWRRLPARPPQLKPATASNGRAVWSGRELLVTGVQEADDRGRMVGGAYDPAADRWRLLPPSPPLTGDSRHLQARTAVWAGTRMLVWNFWSSRPRPAFDESGATDPAGVEPDGIDLWAYDPASNRWRLLPPSPELTGGGRHLQARTAIWAGTRLLVWNFWSSRPRPAMDERGATAIPEVDPDGIDLWAFDPAGNRWTVLPPPPGQVRQSVVDGSMAWDGHQVVMVARQPRLVGGKEQVVAVAGRYDPDQARWTPMAGPPLRGGHLRLAWTGAAVAELATDTVLDPDGDRWLPLPTPPSRAGPPRSAADPERALIRLDSPTRAGATQLYVLEPAKPEP
jgi:hypothetical protein